MIIPEAILLCILGWAVFLMSFIYGSFLLFFGGGKSAQQWGEHPLKRGINISYEVKRYPSDNIYRRGWIGSLALIALKRAFHERGLHHAAIGMFLLAVSVRIFATLANGTFCRP